jgi:hypothetical protein
LTLSMIRLLVERLGISADVLIKGEAGSGDHAASRRGVKPARDSTQCCD